MEATNETGKNPAGAQSRGAEGGTNLSVGLYIRSPKRSGKTAPFGTALKLAWEEHEQKNDQLYRLLVAQLKLYCQFQHGLHLVYAGSAANLLRVGYLLHAVAWRGSRLTANGLERRHGLGVFPCPSRHGRTGTHDAHPQRCTLSRVVARQLGLLAQVRPHTRLCGGMYNDGNNQPPR